MVKYFSLSVSGSVLTIDPDDRLLANRQYTVTIGAGVSGLISATEWGATSEEYTFWFTSAYCPIFTTVGRVKLEAGPGADSISDDTIYRMIHKNSMDIIDIYNISHGTTNAYDFWGCDWQGAPFQFSRYVECKTAYDILALVRIASGSGGDQFKTLGDMSIKYGGNPMSATDPNKLKDLYNCFQESLRMIRNIKVAVKGYYDASKGFAHPVREFQHNRVIKAISFNNSQPGGPWEKHTPWTGYRY